MRGASLLEKTLMLGETEGRRRSRWQRMRWSESITDSVDVTLSKLWEMVEGRGAWCAGVQRVSENQTRLETEQLQSPKPINIRLQMELRLPVY